MPPVEALHLVSEPVSDNNFAESQFTQFLLFELEN